VITSGNFSPMLNRGIALALLRPHLRPGDRVTVDVRGDAIPARVVKTPFVSKTVR
jgi:aminomethyltransferase